MLIVRPRPSFVPVILVALLLIGCATGVPPAGEGTSPAFHPRGWISTSHDEAYRPQLGYSPLRNWMNDPNGLVHLDGLWHIYYQYNPFGDQWGNMSWGHATSRDLLRWAEQPVAIAEWTDPDEPLHAESIFSGCTVIDRENVTGLGTAEEPALLAIYTSNYSWVTRERGMQAQSLAYSVDGGFSFRRYEGNPLVAIPPGNADRLNGNQFRDPRVIWYEPGKKWVMLVTLSEQRRLRFYESADLLDWRLLSEFGPENSAEGIWEVPDLFELPVDGEAGESRWVLVLSVNGGTPYGGSGIQYFVGHFDGTRFAAENLWSPGGADAVIVEDFERGYDRWQLSGAAFGEAPATGGFRGQDGRLLQPPVQAFEGAGFVNTAYGGDGSVGVALSPEFTIDRDFLQFLVGGGRSLPAEPARAAPASLTDAGPRGETAVNLVVDGHVVRSVTGNRVGTLEWRQWDVAELRGRRARIEITDLATGRGGHILADHILMTDLPLAAPAERADWVDGGMDFYAATTFHGSPGDRPLWLGWVSNWLYAGGVPTEGFRGSQSFVRRLALRREISGEGWDLVQTPVGLESLRLSSGPLGWPAPRTLDDESASFGHRFEAGSLLEVDLEMAPGDVRRAGVDLRFGPEDVVRIYYETATGRLAVDRRRSGRVEFSDAFPGIHSARLETVDGRVRIRFFVDWSVVTVFGGGGRAVITDQIFPDPSADISLVLFAEGGSVEFHRVDVWRLRSVWAMPSEED